MMNNMKFLVVLVLSVLQVSQAFAPLSQPSTSFGVKSSNTQLYGFGSESEGGAAIAKPKIGQKQAVEVNTRQKVEIKEQVRTADPVQREQHDFQEAPMYKLMLIGDDGYDVVHVIERMCAICDDMDEDQASTVVQQANQSGKAMMGIYPFERAELFKEQLQRSDPMIYADMIEENA